MREPPPASGAVPSEEGRGDTETLAFYDAHAGEYAACACCAEGVERLDRFARALPPGASVLDLGAGDGWASGRLAEAGHRPLAWDGSEGLLAIAGTRPGVAVRRAGLLDLDERGAFDGVWASFSILHLSLARWPEMIGRIGRAVRRGGPVYIGVKEGSGEARDRLGRFYAYADAPMLRRLAEDAGLAVEALDRAEGRGFDGSVTGILHLHARRADP